MARRSPVRVVIDVAVALCVIACAVIAYAASRDDSPPIPSTVCSDDSGSPDYARLPVTRHLHVTAVLGDIEEGGDRDPSRTTLAALREVLGDDVTIVGPIARDDRAAIERALAAAFADPGTDIVYYNGHEYGGGLAITPPTDGYRLAVLDTCWSTQRYAGRLASTARAGSSNLHVDVVGTTTRAVTGSVNSFLVFVAGLRAQASWRDLLAPMNTAARARATLRAPFSKYRTPERYRHDVSCHSPAQL